jgi:hypothetical protein
MTLRQKIIKLFFNSFLLKSKICILHPIMLPKYNANVEFYGCITIIQSTITAIVIRVW